MEVSILRRVCVWGVFVGLVTCYFLIWESGYIDGFILSKFINCVFRMCLFLCINVIVY